MALSSTIARLNVILGLDTAAFQTGSRKAAREADTLKTKMTSVGKGISMAFAGFAAGVAAGALTDAISGAFELGSAMSEASQRIGVTVEGLQELRLAAQETGVSNEQLESAIGRLNVKLGELQQGEKAAVKSFAAIGLAAEDLKGKDPQEALGLIADKLMEIEDPAVRAAAAQELFGRSYAQLLPLIQGGSKALDEFAQKSREQGQLSTEDAARLDELADNWENLKTRVGVNTAILIANLSEFHDTIQRWVDAEKQWEDNLVAGVKAMATAAVTWVRNMVAGIGDAIAGANAIWDGAMAKVRAVEATFAWLYDRVVGNSHVPDMVAGIAASMQGLDAALVQPARAATRSAEQAFRDMAGETQRLLDRLFPEVRRLLDYQADLATIERARRTMGDSTADAARRALASRYDQAVRDGMPELFEDVGPLVEGIDDVQAAIVRLTERSKVGTVRIEESFKDMAEGVIQSLGQLGQAIKGGGFLDILTGVLGVGLQLAGAGAFGGKVSAWVNGPAQKAGGGLPKLAGGGAITFGGFAGLDRNLLSLNGTPIAQVSRGETAQIVPANDRGVGGVLTVRLEKDGGLTAHMEGIAGRVVAAAAPGIARAGGQAGARAVARAQRKRLA